MGTDCREIRQFTDRYVEFRVNGWHLLQDIHQPPEWMSEILLNTVHCHDNPVCVAALTLLYRWLLAVTDGFLSERNKPARQAGEVTRRS